MSADIPIFISIPTDASPRLVLTITRTLGLAFGILCSFVFVYVCFHLGVNWYQRRHNPEAWAQSKAEQERASEKISCNFFRLGKCFFRLSFSVEEHKRSRGRKSLPFLFALVFIISIIVINSAISQKNPSTNTYVIQMSLLQVGFVLWFLGFNGFLINRIMSYHKQRTEERKRLAKLRRLTCNPGYADAGIPKPDLPPKDQPYLLPSMCTGPSASGLSNSSDVNLTLSAQSPPADSDTDGYSVSSSLDDPHSTLSSTRSGPPTDTHKFKRRIKHIQPQHWKINLTLWNSIQITNIFIEFFQLVSYPLRDLLRNDAFQEYITNLQLNDTYSDDGVIALLNSLRLFFSTLSSGVPSLDYALLMRVQFVVAWWTMLFAWVLVVVSRLLLWALARGQEPTQLAGWRLGCRKFLTGTWILYFIPLVNLFYMILLNAFIEPLGCLISNTVPPWPPRTDANHSQMVQNRLDAIQSRIAYCAPIHDNSPPLNTWFAMSGYLMCYTLLTMFR
ncbi:uncharacterized protein BJ171DRAFT_150162 [Polychytrium aggregatum]|uniref:uncharacterized protein n=1 Tax=Polychytrium aggregatum TaxID=110093 RepID=UPI0022FEE5D6|nr:uncharacterized protein BJ171DRAFT_150162 [Polychytrium aggregatum]KAI9203341.1 hypothetical protein BJ171DRAFT_150162 [Polychytrium aggregatum]